MKVNFKKGDFLISADNSLLDIKVIHGYLSRSYWAKNRPLRTTKKAIQNSVCFGLYLNKTQIGFARVVTDKATFAYLADVFVLEEFRGMGLSKWLMKVILGYDELKNLRRWFLATKDAHGLYEKFGFHSLKEPEKIMEMLRKDL
ncbi:MAG TPA: GNAT family N-acetyltransferase [Ignavibacteria bacterium]|nr:GNAT family N-acetyltransferase [Bacteroidota bacterium]HRI86268.1 GNAT family N-acetyltransferase [Ignavibacteria bacterium]HRJ98388.1 GNAT family N-acetyltransferase [Ignavibacteria bacterium]